MIVDALTHMLFVALSITVAESNSCAGLDENVKSLEKYVTNFGARSYSRCVSGLEKIGWTASMSSTYVGILRSWLDSPTGTFGGGLGERMLRDSARSLEGRISQTCTAAFAGLARLEQEVNVLAQRNQLQTQQQAQAFSTMASLGDSALRSNSGPGMGEFFMSSWGSNVMIRALEGQHKASQYSKESLSSAMDSLYVPTLQAFDSEYNSLAREASSRKEARRTDLEQQRGATATTTVVDGLERASSTNVGEAALAEALPQERGKSTGIVDTATQHPCPHEYFQYQGAHAPEADRQRLCWDVFMSVLASEAAYVEDPAAFLARATRPSAGVLRPWTRERLEKEGASVWPRGTQPEFQVFDATGGVTIIAFKGTENFKDVLTDVQINTVSSIPGGVHAGFYGRSQVVPVELVTELLRNGSRVILTGHSLGGAAATVMALRLLYEEVLASEYQSRISCITFGSPLVVGRDNDDETHSDAFLHVVHRSDIVPRLLMIKKDLYDTIKTALHGTRLMNWVSDLATLAYDTLPWYGKLVADLGQDAYTIYQGADPNAEWFTYKAFGNYFFLHKGKAYFQDQEGASDFLRMMMPDLGRVALAAAWQDHALLRYSEGLEALKASRAPREEL